jgi:hypothetical protein
MKYLSKLIAKDKLNHFFWGAIFSFFPVLLLDMKGVVISLVLFGAKEIVYDYYMGKGNPSFMDFIYSALPVVMFWLMK